MLGVGLPSWEQERIGKMRDETTAQELGFYLADFTDTNDETEFVDWLVAVGL
jgi:hypothetical protein